MNYYPFNLGDYAAHTGHLDLLEDLAYRRMLDLYYRDESPLPADWRQIARLIRMREQGAEIEAVLSEFFTLTDEGWRHGRCDSEIERMQDKQAKAKASAAASVRARSTNAQRTLNERSTKVELPTPTPTPTPEEKKEKSPAALTIPGVDAQTLQDFKALRKAKKAPLTQTAIDGIQREAKKAGLSLQDALAMACERGWTGFKADWVTAAPSAFQKPAITDTVPSRAADETARLLAADTAHRAEVARQRMARLARVA